MKATDDRQTLREKAEQLIDRMPDRLNSSDKKTIKAVFRELQAGQVELERRNESLRRRNEALRKVQNTFEANRSRYASLFDNAPVGYVILDRFGILKQFNNSFCKLIEEPHTPLQGVSFADLLSPGSASEFKARYESFYKNPSDSTMQVRLAAPENQKRELLIEASSHSHHCGNKDPSEELLITVTDISEICQIKRKLEQSLASIKQLKGLIPICASCKKIRDNKGSWNILETYLETHSQAAFSHGICPECRDDLYGEEGWYARAKGKKDTINY